MSKSDHSKFEAGHDPARKIAWTSVENMRPTQCSVGFIEVRLKMAELRQRAKASLGLESYFKAHPIPAVLAPDGRMYLTDHHHLGLAMCKLSDEWDDSERGAGRNPFRKCCFEIIKDHSGKLDMSMPEFFKKMEAHGLCHPYDGQGLRNGAPPRTLTQLKDDPYRSLAGLSRKAGAFDKVDVPYAEFKWADYLRDKIRPEQITLTCLPETIHLAIKLARSPAARNLPGYKSDTEEGSIPSIEAIHRRIEHKYGAPDDAPEMTNEAGELR